MIDEAIGAQIREARETAGLSQQDLAEKLGYSSAATVSYLEAGDRRITVADIRQIADVLGVPIEYFLDVVSFSSLPKKLSLRATGVEPVARRAVTEFFTFAQKHGAPFPPRPVALARRRTGPAAAALLRTAETKNPPVNPRNIAEKMGLPVFDWRFPEEISGLLVFYGDRVAIGINSNHPVARQRFSVAHEIGHFVYGKDDDVVLDYVGRERGFSFESTISVADEVKANQFAADLLMPASWVRTDFAKRGVDVQFLAKQYGVSEQAMWFRLKNLKLISDAE